jgi:hypothetical protein
MEEENFRRSSNIHVNMGSSNSVLLYDKVFIERVTNIFSRGILKCDVMSEADEIILKNEGGYLIQEPTETPRLDPITFILLLPFLPLYFLSIIFQSTFQPRRIRITRIEKLPDGGYEIIEVEK